MLSWVTILAKNVGEVRDDYVRNVTFAYATVLHNKKPLLHHEVNARPWSRVASDLCELSGWTLLVVVDYYSSFTEVESLKKTTSRAVIKSLKQMFNCYGVPDVLMTDNEPQYISEEFAHFAADWQFKHVTSSPGRPRSNGRARNAVKTVKQNVEKKVHQNSGCCSIGEIPLLKELGLVLLNVSWACAARHCCQQQIHC